jgi:DNA polymerase III delta prime subunit
MFNHPLFQALCGGLLTTAVGYLINQLPAIKQFRGKNILVSKLTIEVIILVGIYSLWNTTENKSHELQVLLATVGGIALVFLVWHTFKLIRMLRKTEADNSSTDNTTTELKSPNDWRRELLKVMKIEVETRLNDSLYDDKIIPLITEDRQQAVGRNSVSASTIKKQSSFIEKLTQPFRSLEVFGIRKTQLEAEKPIIEAFEEPDIAGRLLILGNPGAGKTTLLLELARDLIARAQQNPNYPIPVLFELTNWRDDKQIIANWLQADLKFRYNIPEKITREWLSTQKLVPLLDGLDELGLSRQKKCIDKINEFLQSSNLLPLVVCCREEEYQQGEAILNNLRGAVCLQPLSEKQIQNYLRELKCKHLWEGIKNDADGLGELAKTPLFLNLIPVAYPDGLVSKSKRFNSEDERKEYQDKCRKELFDKYIEMRLIEHHDRKGYKAEDVKRWLVWLAKTMKEHKLKEFYIEKMQPSFLENRKQRILYSLIFGLIIWLIGIIAYLNLGIIVWLTLGLILALSVGLFYGLNEIKIQPTETLKFIFYYNYFSVFGFINGLAFGLITGYFFGIFSGLILGLIFGIFSGITLALNGSELINKINPNQGIQESAKHTFIFTLIILPLTILISIYLSHLLYLKINTFDSILLGFGFALLSGFCFAGIPVIQHISLRLILWKNGSIPWNYAHFLKYADERKLINQVGGRFTFIHDKLQEHFARM